MMANEKPGGHGERSVAVGTLDMAVWDAVAKIAASPCSDCSPKGTTTSQPTRVRIRRGWLLLPGKGVDALRAEMRSYLERGYTVVKMKIGGASIDDDRRRIEAVLAEVGDTARLAVDANGRFDLETAIAYAKGSATILCSGTRKRATAGFLSAGGAKRVLSRAMATGENLFSHQDARNLLRYGGMRRTAIGCSSTVRSRTDYANTSARCRC
jgi:L-alanine-DL-glutamate epimerase-like enolase superfamily enzyme